jgi:hypothetical protein
MKITDKLNSLVDRFFDELADRIADRLAASEQTVEFHTPLPSILDDDRYTDFERGLLLKRAQVNAEPTFDLTHGGKYRLPSIGEETEALTGNPKFAHLLPGMEQQ